MAQKMTFEKAIKQLEQIVSEMEADDQPIEKALKKFEEGMKLAKFCSEKLDETEKKITVLMKRENGGFIEKPFFTNDTAVKESPE